MRPAPRHGPLLRRTLRIVAAACGLALAGGPALAGTTGKLTGTVRDAKRQPLGGANVILLGVPLGASSEMDGRYTIFNVPAGTYTVRASLIGHRTTTVTQVAIPADRTTTLDIALVAEALELQEVVVTARRPVVELGLTSNVATVTREEIARLPVQELADIVNLQAGVVDGHFRGGRKSEVQFQVDGITVNNPYDHSATVRLDRSVLEEVQVISGTFDAEYGQAMSGVVNAVLKRGTERFEATAEALAGDFFFPGSERPVDWVARPGAILNLQAAVSGPTGLPRTLFLASARRGVRDGYLRGQREFLVADRSDPDTVVWAVAAPDREPIGYLHDWLGVAKLTHRTPAGIEVGYQAILNGIEERREDWNYRLHTEGLPIRRTFSAVHGLEWTHAPSRHSFYRVSARHNHFDYRDMKYDDVFDPRYDRQGPTRTVTDFEHGAVVTGVDETRFLQRTDALVLAGSWTRHLSADHQIKAGLEVQPARVEFGKPGHLVRSGESFVRHVGEPEEGFPDPQVFRPVTGSAYVQDDLEWNDLRFRAGLRAEMFDPRATVPGDPLNPANSIEGAPPAPPRRASRKLSLSPRLGVSYPVTPRSSLFFAYGHFTQMPQLGQVFSNADYSVLRSLQAGSDRDFGVMGNPDVEPERTVQVQFGYKQEIREWLGLDLTLFYKDIRDLLGVEILTTYNNAEYERLSNADFGNVIGFTLALDQRALGAVSTSLDYTWQVARGNSSDPYETAARRDALEDPRPRQVPLDWDQRHTANLTVTLAAGGTNASAVLKAVSGQPYTPASESGFGGTLETNSGRKPASVMLDLRAEAPLGRVEAGWTVFGRVFNAFDTRFLNGAVFANSGSPFYSRTDTSGDRRDLADPTRLHAPRRVELGLRWQGGGR